MRALVEVKTAKLIGPALDWAVAKAEGHEPLVVPTGRAEYSVGVILAMDDGPKGFACRYSTDWNQGGPLISKYLKGLVRLGGEWCAFALEGNAVRIFSAGDSYIDADAADADGAGETELIATCRAIVAAKLGNVVQVPAELLERAA